MTIKKAAYSKTYPISNLGVWEKIYLEADINEGEDVRQALYALKKQVENFHFESNKAAEKHGETYDISNAKYAAPQMVAKSKEESIILMVNSAQSLKELDMYKNTINSSYAGSPEVMGAYTKKLNELENSS